MLITITAYVQSFLFLDCQDTSANSFSTPAAKPSSATKPRSVLPQKCKTSAGRFYQNLKALLL